MNQLLLNAGQANGIRRTGKILFGLREGGQPFSSSARGKRFLCGTWISGISALFKKQMDKGSQMSRFQLELGAVPMP